MFRHCFLTLEDVLMWRTAARENTAIPQAEGFPGTWTELLLDIQVIRFFCHPWNTHSCQSCGHPNYKHVPGLSIHWREREVPADPQGLLFFQTGQQTFPSRLIQWRSCLRTPSEGNKGLSSQSLNSLLLPCPSYQRTTEWSGLKGSIKPI